MTSSFICSMCSNACGRAMGSSMFSGTFCYEILSVGYRSVRVMLVAGRARA
ncbi:hypothetical protein IGS67_09630 [Flavimobilis sp. GY10621]|uniref:Uncharacterized protein n=1 Tax=Flavimobilis rhizosphaerae TaxID=2775421 RepID=A0ABR9DRW9_9MICO|nr:hypothetical protein [Flavimobilis rhizosphaerae]MBD9699748.1 hypothetical protein [Flavimobilis rhizosphaerae]